MSDATSGPAGELTLRLTLPDGDTLALGRCLVGVVVLEAQADAEVSARLNLVEGDLWVEVRRPSGSAHVRWPWPVDTGPRDIALAAGQSLVAAVPLFATDASQPAFPSVGRYELVAHYSTARGTQLSSAGVAITRQAGDAAATRALQHRDVLQSLLSAGTLGAASDGLGVLAESDHVPTRTLARLALGQPVEEASDAALRAIAAVLPPHASPEDPRRDAALAAADADPALVAMLTGRPV
jgi:hypothetical protein